MKYLVKTGTNKGLDWRNDWDRVLNDLWNGFAAPGGNRSFSADIREEEGRYLLEAELPGIDREDVEIKIEDNLLTIKASQESRRDSDGEKYLIRERQTSEFSRSFVLPRDVDKEAIEARFENGILALDLPKSEESKPRTIKIKEK